MASTKGKKKPDKGNEPDYVQVAAMQSKTGNLWMKRAACRGKTDLMFPKEHKDITYIAAARALCRECPVKTPCLAYALQYPTADIHGVWAGLTSRQLAAKQKELGIKPTKPTLAQLWGD
ncbi:MAG: WhiB family transcriptional regulator [Actinobacteria bacterium]|nr:WhiB family transcriptional regulator [Actinomycetota bacterium]